jgi:hypothetical protein
MADFVVATEMPSGARSRGYTLKDEETATNWYGQVLGQMKSFDIQGSAVLMLDGETEVMRENIP